MEELFIFVSPIAMGVGLWLIFRQRPAGKDKDDASGPS
jgi:hypothetical protein